MSKNYDDATLMAFADGQLQDALFDEIADAVETDPALAQRLELLVLGKDLTKAIYAPLAEQPVPAQLTQAVRGAVAAHQRKTMPQKSGFGGAWSGYSGFAIAACLGVIVAGPLGFFLGDRPGGSAGFEIGTPLSGELAGYVSRLPSGQPQDLADGRVMQPVATFADAGGSLCREFEVDGASASVVVACHQQEEWRVTFALAAPIGADGYAPASALEALDAYLGSIGAAAPLGLDEEAAALQGL